MFTTGVDWEDGLAVYLVSGIDTPADCEAFMVSAIGFSRIAPVERPAMLLVLEPEAPSASIAWALMVRDLSPGGPRRALCAVVSPSVETRMVVNVGSWHAGRHVELFAAPHFDGAVAEVGRRRRKGLRGAHELLRQAREESRGPRDSMVAT